MAADSLAFEPLSVLAAGLRDGRWTPVGLAEEFLSRIAALDGPLHAFLQVTPERALAEARAAGAAFRQGRDSSPLQGIPYAVKDLFDVEGLATTAGTRLRAGHRAAADCTAVARLKTAGMALLGKTHTVQFALGAVGVNHDQGTPHNPWSAVPHVTGGSSSGSAVAVAAGLAPVALGTDTGGSVRIPAALCGLVGLKTTVGRISRAGVYPLSWTLDSVGVLSRTAEDAALVYRALRGPDAGDPATSGVGPPEGPERLDAGVGGLRIAFAETGCFDDVDAEIVAAVREAGNVLRGLGARVEGMAVPEFAAVARELIPSPFLRVDAAAVNEEYVRGRAAELDPIVASRIQEGLEVPAVEYCRLLRRREELQAAALGTLRDVDLLLAPTTLLPALPLAGIDRSLPVCLAHNLKYNRNTALGNYLNLCGASVPCGFTRAGLPIGLMLYAKPFQEGLVLRAAHAYQQATPWHTRRPDLEWAGSRRLS